MKIEELAQQAAADKDCRDDYGNINPEKFARRLFALRDAEVVPVGRVVFRKHRKAPDVDWAVNYPITKGAALYIHAPAPSDLQAECKWEQAVVEACAKVESCLTKDPKQTLLNLEQYWFDTGAEHEQAVKETALVLELRAENERLKAERAVMQKRLVDTFDSGEQLRMKLAESQAELAALKQQEPVAYRHRDGMLSCRLPGGGVAGIDWTPLYAAAKAAGLGEE